MDIPLRYVHKSAAPTFPHHPDMDIPLRCVHKNNQEFPRDSSLHRPFPLAGEAIGHVQRTHMDRAMQHQRGRG